MYFAGTSGAPSGFGSVAWSDIGSPAQRGDSVTIADAHLLFSGNYERAGSDLIVSDHLHRVVVSNYFHGDKRPALVSSEGVALDPKVIEALTGHVQYAQAAGVAAAKVVGHVVKMTGSASIVRNGVTIDLNNGDVVYQNDVVQTGSGSTLGLVLIDGTTFNLTANARLMMNDLTYDPASTSNTSLFTLVQGAANFVAGQVAKTGDMKVSTPVATMGIRGTAVILDISAVDGKVSISVVNQRDGQVHAVQVYNTRGDLIGTVTSNGTVLTLTPTASFEVIAQESNKTVAQVLTEFNAFQQLLSTYDIGKQMVPDTPAPTDGRRGDNNQQPLTKFAGTQIVPSDSSVTKFNAEIGSLKGADGGAGTGDLSTLHATGDATGGIKVAVTIGDTPLQLVTVAATSIPFVVTPSPVSRISSGPGDHFGPVMSADGQFVTYDPDGAIFLFDRQSGTTKTIASPQDGWSYGSPTISSDGHFIVYQGSDGTQSFIFLYNNDASDTAHYGQTTRLMAGGQPAISGDGSRIVVEQGGSIALYDQQSHQLANLTGAALGISGTLWKPAISADGHIIAFWSSDQSTPGGAGQLFAYDLSTATFRSIASTATGAGDSAASFSADGHYVVYQSEVPGGHAEIYLTDLRTGQVVFHTANSDASYNPVISPDGHFIIFASDARLTSDDSNNFADIFVVDVTDPAHPVYKLVSVLDDGTQGNAASNLGATISAGGQFVAFGSSASNFSTGDTNGGGDIFVVDPGSGHSAIILEGRNSPAVLTASGIIKLTGEHSGVTLGVSDSRITASFDSDGNIRWSFSEQRSDFAALQPGEIAVRNFVITLGTDRSTTEIPLKVSIYDVDQAPVPVADAAPVASPVTLAPGTEDAGYTVTSAALLAGVVDIDGPSLSITGLSVGSGGGTIVDNHDGTFRYSPAANYNGPVVFNYTVSDGTLSASSTAHLDIAPVNDAPVLTRAAFAVPEGGTAVLTSSNIAVSDVDNAAATFAVSGVTHGRFQTTADATNWVDAISFTTADLAASHVRFIHDGGEDAPTFSIQADDGEASNHLSATVAGSIQFTTVNDAPTVTGAALTISEGGTVVLGPANIGVTDPDNDSFVFTASNVSHGSFQITTDGTSWVPATTFTTAMLNASHVRFVHDGGENAPTFSIQADDGAGGLSNVLAGSVSFANVNDAPVAATSGNTASGDEDHTISGSVPAGSDVDDASGLTYALESGPDAAKGALTLHSDGTFSFVPATNFNGDASFSYRVVDPHGAQSDPQNFTITVNPVNDAPVLSKATFAVAEGGTAVLTSLNIAASDIDSPALTFTVSGVSHGKFQTTADGTNWVDVTTFTTADLADSHVRFIHDGGEDAPTFSVQANDGAGGLSNALAGVVSFTNVNDQASFVAGGNSAGMAEDDTTAAAGVILVNDADHGENHTASASGTTALGSSWSIDASGHWSYTLNNAAVQHLGASASTTDKFTVASQDGTASEDVTITINGVNDAPSIAAQTLASITEDDAGPLGRSVLDIFGESFVDVDHGSSLRGIAVIGDDSTPGQGTWQYRSSGGSWEAIGQVDPEHALIFAADTELRFVPAPDFNGTPGTLQVVAVDDSYDDDFTTGAVQSGGRYTEDVSVRGGSTPFSDQAVTLGISVTAVNDAPAGSDSTVTTLEDTAYTFAASDFGFGDPDDLPANSLLAVQITGVSGGGTLTNDGVAVAAGQFVSANDIAAGLLKFKPSADDNGLNYASIGFQVRDDGGTANGGVDLDATLNTITVDVTPVNDAPVAVADTGVSITQNGSVGVSFSPILNAFATGVGSEYVITQAVNSQVGALWSNSKISLSSSFTISAELFFGASDDGADGFTFIIQNQSKTAIGLGGGGLGYQGIGQSVAIEFDTYSNGPGFYNDIDNDHAAFDTNGLMAGIGAPIDLGNIEDGQYHPVTIDWNAATHVITLSYNGAVIGSRTIDVAATVGGNEAYTGFAGSTGALNNLQKIRNLDYQSADHSVVLDVLANDTDVDPGDKATLHVVSASSAGGASLTFSGLAGAGIVYSPGDVFDYLAAGESATDTVTYTIEDSHGAKSTSTAQVTIIGLNDAPAIAAQTLAPITEDDGDPAGRSVADIFGGSFQDADQDSSLKGIAVIGNDSTVDQGVWQYRSSGGGWEAIGQPDPQHALIFAADTELRFVPASDFNGTPGSLQVVGVDDSYDDDFTTGSAQPGGRYTEDVSVRGGSTPFSDQPVTLGVSVTAVNDAPLATGAATLAAINEDNTSSTGDTIAHLFGANFSDAADEQNAAPDGSHADTLAGIAISAYSPDSAKGAWQYAAPGGTWMVLGAASASAAITLSADVALRFVPAADYNGSATALGAHLIESGGATIVNGATIDLVDIGSGGSTHYSAATVALGETINSVNDAPVIDGGDSRSVSVAENTTTVTTVAAHDPDNPSLTWSLLTGPGSPDSAKFRIDASGHLSFRSAPDFGNPTDANHNNIYTVQVRVSDGTLSDTQTLFVHVTDANDNAPVITNSPLQIVAENHTFVTRLSAFDVDTVGGPAVFSIANGLDGSLFRIVDGNLQFRTAPDFEHPADSNHNNIYSVTVNASDGLNSSARTFSVHVTNVNEAPVLSPNTNAVTYVENAVPKALMPAGAVADPDHPSSFDDGSLSVSLSGAVAGDELVLATNQHVSISFGNSVRVDGVKVGTISGNHSTHLKVDFNSSATDARVETVMHALSFASTSDNPTNADRTATVTFNDGGNDGSGPALGDSSVVTIHVTPVDDAPVGVGDSYATGQDTPLTVAARGVLANDTDVDTDPATLTAVLVSGPGHGTLTLNPDGSFLYTPDTHYHGPDSFSYRPSDAVTGNLIVNPDAESGTSVDNDGPGPVPLGWTNVIGNFTEVNYSATGGFLMESVGPSINGGHAFFSGGPGNAFSQIKQHIDLGNYRTDIDAGLETANLSGYLGGLVGQADVTSVTAHFLDSASHELGTLTIDPTGRPAGDALFYVAHSAAVPVGTRSVDVVLTSTRTNGAYNDGYADNLSLTLTPQGSATTVNIAVNHSNLAPMLTNPGTVVLGDQVLVSDPADVNYWPVYSADGSKLVYLAGPIDNEGDQRIAVLDLHDGTTAMIDAGNVFDFDGTNAPVVTSNGHFVAFRTDDPAVTGFSGQHAGDYAIMIADTATGARTLVSTNAAGQPLDDPFAPAFSPDGSHIAFWAGASSGTGYNIIVRSLTDANDVIEIPIHNAFRGEIGPLFSPDGSKLAFTYRPDAFSDGSDVKLIDLHNIGAGPTPLLTDAAGGQSGAFTGLGAFSADGSKLAFWSNVDLLNVGTNGHFEIYVEDLASGDLTLVSTTAAGAPSNGSVTDGAVFSPDGTKLAFYSDATNLLPGDTNGQPDVFVKDLITGQLTLVSGTADGKFTDSYNYDPFFSPDGSAIAFDKGDPLNVDNVFTRSFGTSTDIQIGQNAQPVRIAPYLSVSDNDGGTLAGAVIAITQDLHSDQDVLAVDAALADTLGIAVDFNAGTGTLTLTGSASLAGYQSLLRTASYSNSSDDPSGDVRGISIVVSDGAAQNYQSNAATVLVDVNLTPTLDVHAPNDAPVYTFGDPSLAIAPDLTLSDDDNSVIGATVSFACSGPNDLLQFNESNPYGITGSYDPDTGVLTLSGRATAEAYQEVLRTTTFSQGSESAATSRTISFRVEDNAHNISDASAATVTVNHAPVAGPYEIISFTTDSIVNDISSIVVPAIPTSDADGDPLTITLHDFLPDSFKLNGIAITEGQEVSPAELGNLTFDPTWVQTHPNDFTQKFGVLQLTASDGHAEASSALFIENVDTAVRTATLGFEGLTAGLFPTTGASPVEVPDGYGSSGTPGKSDGFDWSGADVINVVSTTSHGGTQVAYGTSNGMTITAQDHHDFVVDDIWVARLASSVSDASVLTFTGYDHGVAVGSIAYTAADGFGNDWLSTSSVEGKQLGSLGPIDRLTVASDQGFFKIDDFAFHSVPTHTGGPGNDVLVGNGADERFYGADGADTFVFNAFANGSGHDTIGDFAPGQDRIQLDYLAFDPEDASSFSNWLADHATQQGNDVLIDLHVIAEPDVDTILLKSVQLASLQMHDFLLHPGAVNTA